MTKPLLLTGANGRTGRAILAAMAHAKIPVRALIRDEAQAPALHQIGATEHVVADLDDTPSLVAAMRGVGKVLHIGPPMHPRETEITRSLIAAAQDEGVDHFIYYSVMHPLSRTIRHHRLKLDAEEALIDSGLPHTILQPSRYMQHLEPIWSAVVNDGVHAMPFSTSRKFSVVDLVDLADACAAVAGTDRYLYGTYELAGPDALSQDDMAATIAQVLDRPVKAVAVPFDTLREKARMAGASDDRIEQMIVMNTHYDQHGFRSNSEVLQMIIGRPATTFRAYVRRLATAKAAAA